MYVCILVFNIFIYYVFVVFVVYFEYYIGLWYEDYYLLIGVSFG